jgi:hypothetical protein
MAGSVDLRLGWRSIHMFTHKLKEIRSIQGLGSPGTQDRIYLNLRRNITIPINPEPSSHAAGGMGTLSPLKVTLSIMVYEEVLDLFGWLFSNTSNMRLLLADNHSGEISYECFAHSLVGPAGYDSPIEISVSVMADQLSPSIGILFSRL